LYDASFEGNCVVGFKESAIINSILEAVINYCGIYFGCFKLQI